MINKNLLAFLAAVLLAVLPVCAQNYTPGVRYESTEISVNDEVYTVFSYTDDDGSFGYYLSIAHVDEILSVSTPRSSASISNIYEACLWLGNSRDEALHFLDEMLSLFEQEAGTVREMPARMTTLSDRLGDDIQLVCEVKKKLLGGKRLLLYFPVGRYEGQTYLNKSTVKQLRWGLKMDQKLHPNKK